MRRLTVAIAIILAASTVLASSQSLQEQGICVKQAESAFQDYHNAGKLGKISGYKLLGAAIIRVTTTRG